MSETPAPVPEALDETRQCERLVSGEQCVLVWGHRGACVKPVPRQDMSDVIRYRVLADQRDELQERLATLEPCYADAQATAARLLIEREQYDQTLRNAEERAQFAVERADAAEAERDQARAELDEHHIAYTALCGERDQLDGQIDRLANFIMREIPGEPSQNRGAVDTAIRLLARATRLAALEEAARTVRESDPLLRGIEQPELRRHLFALYATVDALNASPGEGA